ncbi:MAG TPA: 16S rRNA (guanine(966)-N(2))-methyltransferase RsmD [Peptococcaceae bacterium]|nr:16S rRNA (guanine(966)-N(2))-methyltransferase RsmD [Peptococcaceae bacterium]
MRIIAGDWKGRRLKTVQGLTTRPTSDKVKGAIFNILGSKVQNARILDLFAGTGNLSFEALSRGARQAVLVENDYKAWKVLQENRTLTGAMDQALILKMDAFNFLQHNKQEKFDIIFLDPPYHQELAGKILTLFKYNTFLQPNGVIVLETASDEEIPKDILPLELILTKEYGDTKVWYLQEKVERGEG